MAAVVFAGGLSASHGGLLDHPQRYGQTWQAQAGNFGNQVEIDAGEASAAKISDIEEFGLIRQTGAATIDGQPVYVVSFVRNGPLVRPVIVDGREPGPGEVALGGRTMTDHRLHLGDRVTIQSQVPGIPPRTLTVVGRTIINDGSGSGGRLDEGALVDDSDFPDPGSTPQYLLARGVASRGSESLVDRLRADFAESATPARLPADVANLDRVSAVPSVLAALVAVLAAAALANSLISIIGRRRRDIGVFRALGFSRAQVLWSTIAIATVAALAASIIGVPLGVIATRWGWSAVQSRIGVESAVVIPVPLVVATVLFALAVTQLISLVPGIRATRRRAADALRSE
jgi:putative ABC transport system permease protein